MKYTARTADKFILYQDAVQNPEGEVAFVERVYRRYRGKTPVHFREDFCGTAMISCEWVKRRRDNIAYGVDLCHETLDWGRRNNIARLPSHAADRLRLLQRDVRSVRKPKVDVVGAFNYSYFIFRTIPGIQRYFRAVRASLRPGGIFVLDAYGGYEAQQVMKERTRNRRYTYVWDQADYNPISDETTCHIHFEFPDGTRIRRAFTYHWRLWTLGVLQDALVAAGFKRTEVYWEGTTAAGKGDGVFRLQKRAENCAGWNAYIVALT